MTTLCGYFQCLVGDGAEDGNDYVMMYRGGNTKYTWKTQLKMSVPYKFRVQVRTIEGIGNWSSPVTAFRAEPGNSIHTCRVGLCAY